MGGFTEYEARGLGLAATITPAAGHWAMHDVANCLAGYLAADKGWDGLDAKMAASHLLGLVAVNYVERLIEGLHEPPDFLVAALAFLKDQETAIVDEIRAEHGADILADIEEDG